MKSSTRQHLWAIGAGLLFVIVATTLVDILLHVVGVFPPMGAPLDDRLSWIALSYRILITIGAGYLTAAKAPSEPMKHALILGVLGTLLGGLGVAATWGREMGPSWYPISLMVLAIPECWLGGKIYLARSGQSSA